MLTDDIKAIVQEAIKAERQRIAGIFRKAQAKCNSVNGEGEYRFDFEASCLSIAQAIEEEDEPVYVFAGVRSSR